MEQPDKDKPPWVSEDSQLAPLSVKIGVDHWVEERVVLFVSLAINWSLEITVNYNG